MKERFRVKQYKVILIIILILTLLVPSFAVTKDDTLSYDISVEMVNYNIPGILAVVAKSGEIEYINAFGSANVTTKMDMNTQNSVIQTGSISKVITTYALLELLAQKKIDVDAEIGPYLPAYLNHETVLSQLTFRNLLTHTSGIPTIKANSATKEDPLNRFDLEFGAQAESFFKSYKIEQVIEKDSYSILSNVGYILAGVLIESISGERYAYYLSKQILDPLGMHTSSKIIMNKTIENKHLVQNYAVFGGQREILSPYKSKYLPSDDFLTTAEDMGNFLKTLTSGDLSEMMKNALFQKQIVNNTFTSGRSFGFNVVDYRGYEAYIHDGGIPGENSRIIIIPELELGLFLSYNSNNLRARDALTDVFLNGYLDENKHSAQYPVIQHENLEKFIGVYSPVNVSSQTMEQLTRIIHQIRVSDTQEGLKIDDSIFLPISETVFYSETTDNFAEFRTDDKGQLAYLMVGNTIYERTPFYQSMIVELMLFFLIALVNFMALLIFMTRWKNMKVNRIHDTPRTLLLLHTLCISSILFSLFLILTRYDIWHVIYGDQSLSNVVKILGYALSILILPTFLMLGKAKEDYRWTTFMVKVYQLQLFLSVFLFLWLWIYNFL